MGEPTKAQLLAKVAALEAQLAASASALTATSEILELIANSRTDVQPVFDTISERAVQLCEGDFGTVFLYDGATVRPAAVYNASVSGVEALRRVFGGPPTLDTVTGRAILSCEVIHRPDAQHAADVPGTVAMARSWPYGAIVSVPLLRDRKSIGTINVAKASPEPFAEREIDLLRTFANQAVIAIENVRLFTELQQKNEALTTAHSHVTEALAQQTATSDVLRVLSRSTFDLRPLFDAVAENATRLCEAERAFIFRFDGQLLRVTTSYNASPELREFVERNPIAPGRHTVSARAALERRTIQVADVQVDPEYRYALQDVQPVRTILAVPMLKGDELAGAIVIWRFEVKPFTERQIALLQTFADQAVIAIENVRLFTELQTSNRELTSALEQQTATAEILRVISSSPTDLQPVLDRMAESAARYCQAYDATIFRVDGNELRLVAHHGPISSLPLGSSIALTREGVATRAVLEGRPVHVADIELEADEFPVAAANARKLGNRTMLAVPLLRERVPLGAILLRRIDPDPFTVKQVDLLKTFADQAVIAIENVRLFTELEQKNTALTEALEQQTATADILRVISNSPTNVQPVFDAIVRSAQALTASATSAVFIVAGAEIAVAAVATGGVSPHDIAAWRAHYPRVPTPNTVMGRAILERQAVHAKDLETDPQYPRAPGHLLGVRTILGIPMLREGDAIGAIAVWRQEVKPFTDKQIALLQTFADQAVIAIQNVRLFTELTASNRELELKSRELEVASQHKSEFLASMSHELRTPLNAIIGFSDVLLQGMFGEANEKQTEYLRDILASGQHLLSLINDILDLSKVEAGRMDLDLADFDLPTAIDDALLLMRERASRRSITLERHVDERVGEIHADQRKVKQVLLNLLSNAVKFTPEGGRIDVGASIADDVVEIGVTDTGMGIAPEDHDAVFEEFRQVGRAEKKAEGTGLGLALCRKFVELHGGRISLTSEVGKGSTFTFTIPVGGPRQS